MSDVRAPCTSCGLPFYVERNDACPYCGTAQDSAGGTAPTEAAPADEGDAVGAAPRERVTCEACGLVHYADAGECPYCGGEGRHTHEEPAAAEPESESDPEPAPEATPERPEQPATAEEPDRGFIGGLVASIRSVFGGSR